MLPHTEDPYGQPTLPYQPYIGPIDALVSRQQEIMSPSISARAAASASARPAMPALPARPARARPVEPRMSKAEALEFVDECKRWLIAGSIVVFGILSGLVAAHVTGTTSNQATPASNAPSTSPSSGGGFFQQQQQGGDYFGNGNSGQPPVSGSHVSP
jgi:hypothetical protein